MPDISRDGNAHWQNRAFASPSEPALANIYKKMRYCDVRNVVVWVDEHKPYNTSADGLPGTLRKSDGYRYVKSGRAFIPVSRIAYYLIHGVWPRGAVRFCDGDPTNFAADNLLDSGSLEAPHSREALAKIEEDTQARRAVIFDVQMATRQAEDGLYYFRQDRENKIKQDIKRLTEYAASSVATLMGNITPESERRVAAERNCDGRVDRDAVDRQLARLGATPPADKQAAYRLLLALS